MIGGKTSYTDSNYVVHVVPSGVYLLEYNAVEDAYNEIERYLPANVEHENVQMKPTEITAASINASQIAVAFDRGFIVVLAFSEHKPDFFPFAYVTSSSTSYITALTHDCDLLQHEIFPTFPGNLCHLDPSSEERNTFLCSVGSIVLVDQPS